MIFPVQHPFYDAVFEQMKDEKYREFLTDDEVKRFVTQYNFEKNPVEMMTRRLEDAGFKNLNVELRDVNFSFQSVDQIQSERLLKFFEVHKQFEFFFITLSRLIQCN